LRRRRRRIALRDVRAFEGAIIGPRLRKWWAKERWCGMPSEGPTVRQGRARDNGGMREKEGRDQRALALAGEKRRRKEESVMER
jgi:hypothetical protein